MALHANICHGERREHHQVQVHSAAGQHPEGLGSGPGSAISSLQDNDKSRGRPWGLPHPALCVPRGTGTRDRAPPGSRAALWLLPGVPWLTQDAHRARAGRITKTGVRVAQSPSPGDNFASTAQIFWGKWFSKTLQGWFPAAGAREGDGV